ncbi:hypothetical protein BS78_10G267600 [Paspalum vaginatum]|nr:hypothetical protein BS78_10G267600 [Paspalum vaginatum]
MLVGVFLTPPCSAAAPPSAGRSSSSAAPASSRASPWWRSSSSSSPWPSRRTLASCGGPAATPSSHSPSPSPSSTRSSPSCPTTCAAPPSSPSSPCASPSPPSPSSRADGGALGKKLGSGPTRQWLKGREVNMARSRRKKSWASSPPIPSHGRGDYRRQSPSLRRRLLPLAPHSAVTRSARTTTRPPPPPPLSTINSVTIILFLPSSRFCLLNPGRHSSDL